MALLCNVLYAHITVTYNYLTSQSLHIDSFQSFQCCWGKLAASFLTMQAERSQHAVCVHEGVKLLYIRDRERQFNRKQLVLNKAFDFPALENPMLSRWQQSKGKLLTQYVALACATKTPSLSSVLSCNLPLSAQSGWNLMFVKCNLDYQPMVI